MCKLTREQHESLKGIFRRDQSGHKSYRTFRKSVTPMFLGKGTVMVLWGGGMIGIKPNGHVLS